jgi:hypothetical protein
MVLLIVLLVTVLDGVVVVVLGLSMVGKELPQ